MGLVLNVGFLPGMSVREALREARSFAYRYDVSLECEFNEHKFYVYGRMTDADLQREEENFMRRFEKDSKT